MKIEIKAKCVGCNYEMVIKAGDVALGDYPMCPKCFMPMIAKAAKGAK